MFHKLPLTTDEQIALLKERRLIITENEETDVRHWLNGIAHYYKLSGYWRVYELSETGVNGHSHLFKTGITWELVKNTYVFDQKLRNILSEAIEIIEVSLKTRWANHLSLAYGSHPQEQRQLFNAYIYQNKNNSKNSTYGKLVSGYARSKTLYANHYKTKYPELRTPPIWVAALIITFGELINWVKYLRHPIDRNAILTYYGYDERIMIPFLTHLVEVRNICAHNGRLWNRKTTKNFTPPKALRHCLVINAADASSPKIYNTIVMISEVLRHINSNDSFLCSIRNLLHEYPMINLSFMGFPPNWQDRYPWKQ